MPDSFTGYASPGWLELDEEPVNVFAFATDEIINTIVPKTIYKKTSGISGSNAVYEKIGYDENYSVPTTGFEA